MSTVDIEAIDAIYSKATVGKWRNGFLGYEAFTVKIGNDVVDFGFGGECNAEFSATVKNNWPAISEEINRLRAENASLLDTIKAILVACGGSENDIELKAQLDAAGSKPSDFIAAIGGRLLDLILNWTSSGRYGYGLPVIQVDLMSDIERILRGEKTKASCPQCETPLTFDELKRCEGVCEHCCEQNQAEINDHYARLDHWESLSDDERDAMIDAMIK